MTTSKDVQVAQEAAHAAIAEFTSGPALQNVVTKAVEAAAATPSQMERDNIQLAQEAAHAAIAEFTSGPAFQDVMNKALDGAFERLGMEVSTPEAREKFRKDMTHLRDWREAVSLIRSKGLGAVVVALVTGTLGLLGLGIKQWLWG